MYRYTETPLEKVVTELRAQLPAGAPLVAVPSVRARDHFEIARGVVLPIGLASPRFCVDWFGDYMREDRPVVWAFSGTLAQRHQNAVVAMLEDAARAGTPVALVADDFDHAMMSLMVVNHVRSTVRVTALIPQREAGRGAVDTLCQLAAARPGEAGEMLSMGTGGTLPRMLATIDECVALGEFAHPDCGELGILYVGGRDLAHARSRVRDARL